MLVPLGLTRATVPGTSSKRELKTWTPLWASATGWVNRSCSPAGAVVSRCPVRGLLTTR